MGLRGPESLLTLCRTLGTPGVRGLWGKTQKMPPISNGKIRHGHQGAEDKGKASGKQMGHSIDKPRKSLPKDWLPPPLHIVTRVPWLETMQLTHIYHPLFKENVWGLHLARYPPAPLDRSWARL